ncbi:hypothetical protein ABW21_db0207707 [Orbilia brochopaga]|nr:hypothetical protein ABW21_db0207707 [Drechslerella brochopaga]
MGSRVFGLRYEDLLWKPASTLAVFIFYKVWFQGVVKGYAIYQPIADLHRIRSRVSFHRVPHITPLNGVGKVFRGSLHEVDNGLWILASINLLVYVTSAWQVPLLQTSYEIDVKYPIKLWKAEADLEAHTKLPPIVDIGLLALQKYNSGEFFPPYSTAQGTYTPVFPLNGQASDRSGSVSTVSDFIYANFSSCVELNATQLSFLSREGYFNHTPVVEYFPAQLNVPNCQISDDPLPYCPFFGGSMFYNDSSTRYSGVCGGWRRIRQSATGTGQRCELYDHFLIHEVASPVPPRLLPNNSAIYPRDNAHDLRRVAVACLPTFWIARDVPVQLSLQSLRVISGSKNQAVEFGVSHNSTAVPLDERLLSGHEHEQHSWYRYLFTNKTAEAIKRDAKLHDHFGSNTDVLSRLMERLYDKDVPGLPRETFHANYTSARANTAFASLFALYIATQPDRWFPYPTIYGTEIEGVKIVDVATANVSRSYLIIYSVTFALFFIFSFPFPARANYYRAPRPLDCIANYLTYIYSSPLLREVRGKADADLQYDEIGKSLEKMRDPNCVKFTLDEVAREDDPSSKTYTVVRRDIKPVDEAGDPLIAAGYGA